jgi:hypothetical protein
VTDPFDDELQRFMREFGALSGEPDADGDGEPDGIVEPGPVQESPLLFDQPTKVGRPTAKQTVRGRPSAVARGAAKVVSPKTAGRAAKATGRGTVMFADWLYSYYTAADKMDLRSRNPRAHHDITVDRRNRTLVGFGCFLLLSLIVFGMIGILGTVVEFVVIMGTIMLVGKGKDPILDLKAGEDIGMGETRIQRAIARAVFGVDLENEKNKDWYKNVIVRLGWCKASPDSDTMTIRLGLPAPHSAYKAKAKEMEIAAALDLARPQVRVLPDPAGDNAGDFDLIIYSTDPWHVSPSTAQCTLRPERLNVWKGVDFGFDIDRQPVWLQLIGKSMLIGGLPEMGKTTTALTLMANLVLDPYVRLWVADAKGVDTAPLIPLAYRYIGASQDEMIEMLDEIEAWGRRKLAALKEVRQVKFSESLSLMHRELDPNHPLSVIDVIYIDEARFYTNGNTQIKSNRIVSRLSRIIEMFRAVGIIVIVATQRPTVKNIPSEIRDLLRIRLAHACTTPTMSNTILGEGAAGLGYTASSFDEDNPGVGWLRVLKSFRQIRPHLTDVDSLERCCKVAYDMRESTGTLPEQVDASGFNNVPQILLDMEALFNAQEWTKAPTNAILPLLAKMAQGYDGMSATDLASQLANWGIKSGSTGEWIWPDGKKSANVRGYYLKHVQDAIQREKKKVTM